MSSINNKYSPLTITTYLLRPGHWIITSTVRIWSIIMMMIIVVLFHHKTVIFLLTMNPPAPTSSSVPGAGKLSSPTHLVFNNFLWVVSEYQYTKYSPQIKILFLEFLCRDLQEVVDMACWDILFIVQWVFGSRNEFLSTSLSWTRYLLLWNGDTTSDHLSRVTQGKGQNKMRMEWWCSLKSGEHYEGIN